MLNFINKFNELIENEGLVCCDLQKDGPYKHISHLADKRNAFYVHARKDGNFRIMINKNLVGRNTDLAHQLKNLGFTSGCSTNRHLSEFVYERFNPNKFSDGELKIVLFALKTACINYKINCKIYC